jgi:hypothetical protein
VAADRIVLPIVTAPSHHVPHLQLADLVVAATTTAVAGLPHGMELAPLLRELMVTSWYGNRGGSGIVLRPNTLVNLYYWVFGEPHYMRNSIGLPIPIANLPYDTDEGAFDRPNAGRHRRLRSLCCNRSPGVCSGPRPRSTGIGPSPVSVAQAAK